MADILHRVGIATTPQKIHETLTTLEGNRAWWDSNEKDRRSSPPKWATFLLSMKALLEAGKGRPAPGEVQISVGG